MKLLEMTLLKRGKAYLEELEELEKKQEESRPFSLSDEQNDRIKDLRSKLDELRFVRFLIKKEKDLFN